MQRWSESSGEQRIVCRAHDGGAPGQGRECRREVPRREHVALDLGERINRPLLTRWQSEGDVAVAECVAERMRGVERPRDDGRKQRGACPAAR